MAEEMRESTYWILTAMTAGRRHGYALLQEVADLSAGRVDLKVTTLYTSLERLQRDGLVSPDGEELVDGRRRRYFRLTDAGAAALVAETSRLRMNAAQATARLRAHGWAFARITEGAH